ncbi:hypothetical protein AVEN_236677-1 [Araneus ventricosus]|uniref:Uncharacterized protein n=1 Tax=Araneus ventricosus TaxID=182803 RepID=A0A4Y2MXR5_ARAVE|nr:hypothetical protein AVEN_4373-1 [Araneus ventricosus]GBN31150.1 hypothetical protein AVEN_236677-1 [Araneus ventricosus]
MKKIFIVINLSVSCRNVRKLKINRSRFNLLTSILRLTITLSPDNLEAECSLDIRVVRISGRKSTSSQNSCSEKSESIPSHPLSASPAASIHFTASIHLQRQPCLRK